MILDSECRPHPAPAEVFSTLESGNKMVTLTSDMLFVLLVSMLTNVYKKKKQKTESRGPWFEFCDFVVKLGSMTVGNAFKVKQH